MPTHLFSVWFYKLFEADVLRWHCFVSTVDLKWLPSLPLLYHCLPRLFALFICPLHVMDAVAWHIQPFQSSTSRNHTQEDSVQSFFSLFCVNLPLAASLDTSCHYHMIKVSSTVRCQDKCNRGDTHKDSSPNLTDTLYTQEIHNKYTVTHNLFA